MRGFILAAGFGTRLRPLTNHVSKSLLPVCGTPLLHRRLQFLVTNGMAAIGVNSHYLHEQFVAFRKQCSVKFELFHESDSIRGSGGPLYVARDFLAQSDVFCICNAEPLTMFDLSAEQRRFEASGSICTLLAASPEGEGTICFHPETGEYAGPRTKIGCTPDLKRADFIGVALYRKEFLDLLRPDDFSILPVWKRAQQNGLSVKAALVDNIYWRDIGTPAEYARIHFECLEGRFPLDIPSTIKLDIKKKTAVNRALPEKDADRLEEYVWCEADSLPPDTLFSQCIILDGSSGLEGKKYITSRIISFGEHVAFE
ncbi:MAG: hypothetical protein GF350_09805 [Chitinivibrionales bacterium]|nr:hypothetical protein [Chitinivibrionales bacterium]